MHFRIAVVLSFLAPVPVSSWQLEDAATESSSGSRPTWPEQAALRRRTALSPLDRRSAPPDEQGSSRSRETLPKYRLPLGARPEEFKIAGMSKKESKRIFASDNLLLSGLTERTQPPGNLGTLREPRQQGLSPGQPWKVADPLSDNWHKQLPDDLDHPDGRMKARLMEKRYKTKVAVAKVLIPEGADRDTRAQKTREISDAIDKGTLKPETVLKGRAVEAIIAEMRARRDAASAGEGWAVPEAGREQQQQHGATAPVQAAHGGQMEKAQEEDPAAKAKKERKARKKKAQRAKKKASQLATVDEAGSPQRQSSSPPPQRAESGSSSARSGDNATSVGTSVYAEEGWHEGTSRW